MADGAVTDALQDELGMKLTKLKVEDDPDLAVLDLGKKKKKKKKELNLDEQLDEAPAEPEPVPEEVAETTEQAEAAPAADDGEMDLDLDLSLKKKKKKKKTRRDELDELDEAGDEAAGPTGSAEAKEGGKGKYPWSGTDRDYTHEELLDRVFGILREKNPELTGERRRTLLKPPQVAREGTRRTVFTNFADLCKAMNRQQEHVSTYLLAELGTTGSLDGQSRLVVKGRFLPKGFETVLRRYVNEYVLCPGCKSVDTLLDRDSATRLMHLRCQQCGASRTVSAIKTGFVARVGKRSQQA